MPFDIDDAEDAIDDLKRAVDDLRVSLEKLADRLDFIEPRADRTYNFLWPECAPKKSSRWNGRPCE